MLKLVAYGHSSSAFDWFIKKSVRAVLVARSAIRGSGIAHWSRTSKQRRSLTQNMLYAHIQRTRAGYGRTIHIH